MNGHPNLRRRIHLYLHPKRFCPLNGVAQLIPISNSAIRCPCTCAAGFKFNIVFAHSPYKPTLSNNLVSVSYSKRNPVGVTTRTAGRTSLLGLAGERVALILRSWLLVIRPFRRHRVNRPCRARANWAIPFLPLFSARKLPRPAKGRGTRESET